METLISLLGPIWPYIVAAVGAGGVLLKVYLSGRKSERNAQKAREAEANAKSLERLGDAIAAGDRRRLPDTKTDPNNRDNRTL